MVDYQVLRVRPDGLEACMNELGRTGRDTLTIVPGRGTGWAGAPVFWLSDSGAEMSP